MAKVKEMKGLDREIAEKLHAIVKANAPGLAPRTWYGMPAYAGADGKAVIFFTPADQVQGALRDARLQHRRQARRRQHLADVVRRHQDRRRRGKEDRRAGEEGRRLSGKPLKL